MFGTFYTPDDFTFSLVEVVSDDTADSNDYIPSDGAGDIELTEEVFLGLWPIYRITE